MLRELLQHFGEKLRLLDREVSVVGTRQAEIGDRVAGIDRRLQHLIETQGSLAPSSSKSNSLLMERLSKVERRQKAVIVSAQRALQTALETQKQQRELCKLRNECAQQLQHTPSSPQQEAKDCEYLPFQIRDVPVLLRKGDGYLVDDGLLKSQLAGLACRSSKSVGDTGERIIDFGSSVDCIVEQSEDASIKLEESPATSTSVEKDEVDAGDADENEGDAWNDAVCTARATLLADHAWFAAGGGARSSQSGHASTATSGATSSAFASSRGQQHSGQASPEASAAYLGGSELLTVQLETINENVGAVDCEAASTEADVVPDLSSPAAWRQRRRRQLMGLVNTNFPAVDSCGSAASSSAAKMEKVASTTGALAAAGGGSNVAAAVVQAKSVSASSGTGTEMLQRTTSGMDEATRLIAKRSAAVVVDRRASNDEAVNPDMLESWANVIEQSLEVRLQHGLSDVCRRLDHLQTVMDEEVLRSVSSRLPEALRKIDALSEQCQDLEARGYEMEVRLGMLRATVDGHDQQLFICNKRTISSALQHAPIAEGQLHLMQQEVGGDAAPGAQGLSDKVDMHMQTISKLCKKLQS